MTYWILFYLMLYFHGGAMSANSMIFDEYAWTNRLVIMITDKKTQTWRNKSDGFLRAMFVTLMIEI